MQLKKHERGVIAGAVVTAATLVIGLVTTVGGAATAASSSPSPSATASTGAPSAASTPTATSTPSSPAGGSTSAQAIPPTAAASITAYGAAGRTTLINVLAHSACNGSTTAPCAYSDLRGSRLPLWGAPAGVTATVLSTGIVSVAVDPSFAVPATVSIKYGIIDQYGTDAAAITFVVAHAAVTPSIGVNLYIGRSQTFDLLARIKCDDLTSPCPASALKSITIGADKANPLVKGTATSTGSVTVSIDAKQPPFTVAHIPYTVTDKYGSSSGVLVVNVMDGYNPKSEWIFNHPLGSPFQQQNIYRRVVDMVNHAPPGATIEAMTYTLDGTDLVNALVNAKKRGVHVRIIQSQGIILGQVPYLQQQLGSDPRGDSFYYICHYACRAGHSGTEHSKIFGVTQTGLANNVVYTASSNWSYGGGFFQWFDGYLDVNSPTAFQTFAHIFSEARQDAQPSDWQGVFKQTNSFTTYIYPITIRSLSEMTGAIKPAVTAPARTPRDWAEEAISQIGCKATGTHGANGRTVVRITMRALYGARGYDIGYQLAQLARAGCDVRVIVSGANPDAIRVMKESGIQVQELSWNWRKEECRTTDNQPIPDTTCWEPGSYTHMHAMAVSGNYGNQQMDIVWTGSEGWNTDSYYNDEQWVRLAGGQFYQRNLAIFDYNWKHYVHSVGLKPTSGPPYAPITYP